MTIVEDVVPFIKARLVEDEVVVPRQCRATRAMLEKLVEFSTSGLYEWSELTDIQPVTHIYRPYDLSETLAIVAAVWSDHPDYRQEWAA